MRKNLALENNEKVKIAKNYLFDLIFFKKKAFQIKSVVVKENDRGNIYIEEFK
jgi:hypothetical protein